ncbi:MAG: hypothetical protein O7C75_07680 [Verrucomicrobia bacterium]|nr:hypothetical protein [Verrucomicrobiota bacterium]
MSNRLQTFVNEHPEFFEEKDGYWRLSPDIRDLMDRYARAYNKDEYNRLRVLVEEAKEKERQRLQSEIDKWTMECAEEQQKAHQIELQLQGIEQKLHLSKRRVKDAELSSKPVPVLPRSWYHSGAVFLILALSGVSFIYLGIIINERVSMSYLLGGISCLVGGFYIQSGGPRIQSTQESVGVLQASVIKVEQSSMKIVRIKRATLLEKKRVANQSVASSNRKINHSIAKLNTLNG